MLMRYHKYSIVFNEIPREVTLAFSITGCGGPCKNCHSPFLHDKNKGKLLTDQIFLSLVKKYKNQISCILFLGGEWEENRLNYLLKLSRRNKIKTALYTRMNFKDISRKLKYNLTYLKVGEYLEGFGGLESVITNQRLYQLKPKKTDITKLFWPQAKPRHL